MDFRQVSFVQWLVEGIRVIDRSRGEDEVLKFYDFEYSVITRNHDNEERFNFNGIYLKRIAETSAYTVNSPISFEYYGISLQEGITFLSEGQIDSFDEYGYRNDVDVDYRKYLHRQFVYPAFDAAARIKNFPVNDYSGAYFDIPGSVPSNSINLPLMMNGSLRQINLPQGGVNRIFYEPNTYFDPELDSSIYAGGLRISRIEIHDGTDHNKDIVRKYKYTDDQGRSSGVLLYKPTRAFQLHFHKNHANNNLTYYETLDTLGLSQTELWKRLTVVMRNDLASDSYRGYMVGYKRTTILQEGAGKSVYEFNIPIPYGSPATENWTPAETRFARNTPANALTFGNCSPMLPLEKFYSYPFAPNPHVYGQGLLSSVKIYNEAGDILEKTENEYVYDTDAAIVYGIKFDKFKGRAEYTHTVEIILPEPYDSMGTFIVTRHEVDMFIYSRYAIHTNIRPNISKTTKTSYDLENPSAFVTQEKHFEYAGGAHDYVTHSYTVNSDGTEYHTRYKYPGDYTFTGPVAEMDEASQALAGLIEKNIIAVPVETYSYSKNGSVETMLSGSIGIFRLFRLDSAHYDVNLVKTLSLPPGMARGSFTPSSVSNPPSPVFVYDPAYSRATERMHYGPSGNPQSIVSYNRQKSGTHYNHRLGAVPKITFSNALANEVVFSDFESKGEYDFLFTASNWGVNEIYGDGRIAGKSLNMLSGSAYKIFKNFTKGTSPAYVFSCWLNTGEAGTLTVTLSDGMHAPVSAAIGFENTAGKWKYYTVKLPVHTLNNSLTLEAVTDGPVWIDDVIGYPASAAVVHYLYGKGLQKAAETSGNGLTVTYEYDQLGRLIFIRDPENNIIKKYGYSTLTDVHVLSISRPLSRQPYVNEAYEFFAVWQETTGVTFKWKIVKDTGQSYSDLTAALHNFSSGVSVVSGSALFTHTFNSLGKYYVSLQASNGAYTHVSSIVVLTVELPPLNVEICSNRPLLLDVCNPNIFDHSCNPFENPGLNLQAIVSGGSGTYHFKWINEWGNMAVTLGTAPGITFSDYMWPRAYTVLVTDAANENVRGNATIHFQTFWSDPDCINPYEQ